jgi:hypothetical protein
MPEKETAGPSTALRSGRDDNSVMAYKCFATELLSRPEEPSASGPPKVMKNGCCSATALHGSVAFPFVIPTRISCHAALDTAACAPFRKERRMKCINAMNLNRKFGGAQPRDLQFSGPFVGMFFRSPF